MRIFATFACGLAVLFMVNTANADEKQDLLKQQFSEDVIRQEEEAFFRLQAEKEKAEAEKKAAKRSAAKAKSEEAKKNKKTPVAEKKTPVVVVKKIEPVKVPENQDSDVKKEEFKVPQAPAQVKAEAVKSEPAAMQNDVVSTEKNTVEDDKAALTKAAELESEKLAKKNQPAVKVKTEEKITSSAVNKKTVKKKNPKDIRGLLYSALATVVIMIAGFLWFRNKKSNEEMMNVRNYHRNRNRDRGRFQR